MVDTKTKGKIINTLRRLTYTYGPRNECKKRTKRDKALFECELCFKYCYDGKSKKTYEAYKLKYPSKNVQMEKCQADHKLPVIPIQKNWQWSWDDFINNLFCSIDNLQNICTVCHNKKSAEEAQRRKALRNQ